MKLLDLPTEDYTYEILSQTDSEEHFNQLALQLFKEQSEANAVYKQYISHLPDRLLKIDHYSQIPCMPIQFFKYHEIKSTTRKASLQFESSGTTGQVRSKHALYEPECYHRITVKGFEASYGPLKNFEILALLPSYLERSNASLVYMVEHFMKLSAGGNFYLNDFDALIRKLKENQKNQQKTLLIGVSFALLDLSEMQLDLGFDELIVMETGGMKGRRKEMIRKELHELLSKGLGVNNIHSEYGMTELLSQAYSTKDGIFHSPSWMRVVVKDITDPFLVSKRSGKVNVIDLANRYSCAFIETEDIGRVLDFEHRSFEVLGRSDISEVRGCNLMVSDMNKG
ncbi:MAG: acyl transferase [Cyclobacteriaceae bacterium]|nr:acyl transferase [Cyclobacteriaceae bacterium]MCH8517010.1 acyl transferase [Cyclobacteriaceae bacterium]